ncbi:ribulose-phosphate 3-epimerase [Amnibacterium flavum]|uniref:Ribulose-phosphate 3-epimerase n=1 Tax=Amnibacterium flavum TaxID=2173173 RepID=A0A2V1HP05_9MICO|nr:ribulose-phosphate 3-epimerase [Amnibacterium flavum]PVZ94373.1 ribulose-phosphate 3-epimerase [Amnibacterium flavum]
MSIRIHPSILAADFANFESELRRISRADSAHVDVMDNHFVPNLTFGLPVVERLAEVSPVPLDLHLMIDDPDRWAPDYATAGADSVTFHVEAAREPVTLARAIRAKGAKVGLALKPGTPVEPWLDRLDEFDMILVMTVEPGFGGQEFMHDMMPKVRLVADAAKTGGHPTRVQVDGGVGPATIGEAARNGADTFVAGSSVFRSPDPDATIHELRRLAEKAVGRA